MDYKEAGVDIEKGDLFVKRIKSMVGETLNHRVKTDLGGFAAMYEMDEQRYLSASTDGVGTKLKLAIDLDFHETIGVDLVAMCANDLICNGSRPLFFLDYFASGQLELKTSEAVIKGIVEGCKQSGMALIGGETAEMPDMYAPKHYDLAGFSVGEVFKKDVVDGGRIKSGDSLIALKSSGFHSNGYSLIRKLIKERETELKKDCLTPTTIYVRLIQEILKELQDEITGIANITGGGVENIPRMNESFGYQLDSLPEIQKLPKHMQIVIERASCSRNELYKTFNMGMGMVIATKNPKKLKTFLNDKKTSHFEVGRVVDNFKGVRF
ncbi:MAG: phosphoribosylformylglycinamidine cyclo-ligase [Bacteriovoracaceae bacterium]